MNLGKFFLVALSLALLLVLAKCFDLKEEDLASEESLWELYEKWRSHHTASRDLNEKHKRFNVFKENVKHVHKVNISLTSWNWISLQIWLTMNFQVPMPVQRLAITGCSKVSDKWLVSCMKRLTIFQPLLIGENKEQLLVSRTKENVVSFPSEYFMWNFSIESSSNWRANDK